MVSDKNNLLMYNAMSYKFSENKMCCLNRCEKFIKDKTLYR